MSRTTKTILPAKSLHGCIQLPGDKSISHRVALIGSISEGVTELENYPDSADCRSTLSCLGQLGVEIAFQGQRLVLEGRGLGGLKAPEEPLDAGNSGTTARLLAGILAGHSFSSTLSGDFSLSQRPMGRIVDPLLKFGARIDAVDGNRLPLYIEGGDLIGIDYTLKVASAQVKSAILFAGLHASGKTLIKESTLTRDHTEISLAQSGSKIIFGGGQIEILGEKPLEGRSIKIPGDISSAAFLISAALLLPHSHLRLENVGVNPTRSTYLSLLERIGAGIQMGPTQIHGGEVVGDINVMHSTLGRIEISRALATGLIDELPILAIIGTKCRGGLTLRGAQELRLKESDRINALVTNLRKVGISVEEFSDGFSFDGPQVVEGGAVGSFGDHRIAMAFAIAGLISKSGIEIEDAECVEVSYPRFFEVLEGMVDR